MPDILSMPPRKSPGSRIDGSLLLQMLSSHPGRQRMRWFRSYLNPSTAGLAKTTPQEGKTLHIEQSSQEAYMGIFDAHKTSRTYREAFGGLDESSTTVVYIPASTPLSMGDHVIPWGKVGDGSDAAKMITSQALLRGGQRRAGVGTITISGTSVVATSAHGLVPGDVIWVFDSGYLVSAVPTSTTATLSTSPGNFTSIVWEVGRDWVDALYPSRVEAMLLPSISPPGDWVESDGSLVDMRHSSGPLGTTPGEKQYFLSWRSLSRLAVGDAYSANIAHIPVYRVSEAGISLPGFDYDAVFEQIRGRVVDSPQSLPQMAVLTLVPRLP